MDLTHILLISAALVFGCTIQGAVGFGAGMFAIPLMLWAGEDLPSAIAITLGGVAIQCLWNLYRYRAHVAARELIPLFALRVTFMPVGVVLLGLLVAMGADRAKQVVGLVLLIALGLQWLFKIKPREHISGGWVWVAGIASGLAAGLVGMGGPPVVLWVMAHDWPAKKSRAFLWATFVMLIPFNLLLLVYRFGGDIGWAFLLGLCLSPLVVAGSEIGQRIGELMNRHRLRFAALMLLLMLALTSILSPLLSG